MRAQDLKHNLARLRGNAVLMKMKVSPPIDVGGRLLCSTPNGCPLIAAGAADFVVGLRG